MARILILEDERVVARDLQGLLAKYGYETSMAASGEDAINIARQERPDVALVDIHLAGTLDGIETAQTLQQQMEVGVVYLTAQGDEPTLKRAEATHPLGYIVKPFAEATLKATLRMAVAKAAVERRDRMDQEWRTGVLDRLTVGLIAADAGRKVRMMNDKAQSLSGWPEAEARGKDLAEILKLKSGDNTEVTGELFQQVLNREAQGAMESPFSLVSRSGEETSVECGISAVQDEKQEVIGASVVFWPARADEETDSAHSADGEPEFDAITGLPGRAQARNALFLAQKARTKMFAALFVLERYYRTGRKYGSATANEVLKYYCAFLAQQIQASHHCGGLFHWAGPSFLALLGPWDSPVIAQREIGRFGRMKLVEEFQASSRTVLLSISATLKVFPVDMPQDQLLSQLDSFLAVQTKADQDLVTPAMN